MSQFVPAQVISEVGDPLWNVLLPGWAGPLRIGESTAERAAQYAGILWKVPSNLQEKVIVTPVLEDCHKTGKKGRPALSIPVDLIRDTLRRTRSIILTAKELHCSRPYIYKVIGAEKTRELVKE